jgi:indolepyruvate ferredoxin oxidoreductase
MSQTFRKRLDTRLLPPTVNEIERELVFHRLEAARRYAYANGLDRVAGHGPRDRLGLVVAGRHHQLLHSAFDQLGIGKSEREDLGIRLFRVAMVYPLEPRRLFEFADGLETIVVLDDRRGFLEEQIRSALCNQVGSPLVLGQRDDAGKPWLAAEGALTAELLSARLGPFLSRRFSRPEFEERSKALARRRRSGVRTSAAGVPTSRRPACPKATPRLPESAVTRC